MLKQYFSIKAQHPEAVLLYRVGDFYETYSDDAVLASKVLGIVLTKRSNGDKGSVEMAGFPHHAIETYLQKLVRAGYKVAICDQLEDPALVKTKLVKRGITEILTPGIAFGENMLDQKEHNYLAGLNFEGRQCGAALLDVSTGTFQVAQGSVDYIATLLSSFGPKELVVQRDVARAVKEKFGDYYVTSLDEWAFVYDSAAEKLRTQLQVSSLKGFGVERFPLAICSAGALLVYLEQTQHSGLRNICSISRIDEDKFVWMDQFTIRNLEIFQSSSGRDGVSLVDTIDRCCSPMGSRLLRQWLSMPIIDIRELDRRYDIVQHFLENPEKLSELQLHISGTGDLERTISRVATGKIFPREMLQLGRSLSRMEPIRLLCSGSGVDALDRLAGGMRNTDSIFRRITGTLAENPAAQIGKGDVIAPGVSKELDELREISRGGKEYLLQMQQREMERTGISTLKISYNNVFGYYIEVRNSSRDKVPPEWIRKQTLVNAERYITPELKEYEEKILGAEATIYETESRLYAELIRDVQQSIRDIQQNCGIIAGLDVLQGFAQQAADRNYCRPVVDKSSSLEIKAGRHPVIETLMAPGGGICAQRHLHGQQGRPDNHPDRSEHGWKIGAPAADRAHSAHGAVRLLRSRRKRTHRLVRQDIHAGRSHRQHIAGRVHLHGGDAGDRDDHAQPVGTLARAARRDRPRHLDLRRNVHSPRPRGIHPHLRKGCQDPVRHTLPRTERPRKAVS